MIAKTISHDNAPRVTAIVNTMTGRAWIAELLKCVTEKGIENISPA